MTKNQPVSYRLTALFIILAVLAGFIAASSIPAQAQEGQLNLERVIDAASVGLSRIDGAAYSKTSGLFWLFEGQDVIFMDAYEQLSGSARLAAPAANYTSLAFNDRANSLYGLDASTGIAVLEGQSSSSYDLKSIDSVHARGITFDPASGTMYVLDQTGKSVLAAAPGSSAGETIRLSLPTGTQLRSLAFNPEDHRLYALSSAESKVHEFNLSGRFISTRDLSAQGVSEASEIFFAPSGDLTDNPSEMSLYVVDGSASLVELSLSQPVQQNSINADMPTTFINMIKTWAWNPPSSDPTGIDYMAAMDKILVVDSDIDETVEYQGVNVWVMNTNGDVTATCSTAAYSMELTGSAFNPATGLLYLTDDDKVRISVVDVGTNGQVCNNDDTYVRYIDPKAYGSIDPTGIAFANGLLYITDGLNYEVYVIDPSTDALVAQYDTGATMSGQPQGIAYHPARGTFFIVTRFNGWVFEANSSMSLLNRFNIRDVNMVSISDVTIAPASTDPSKLNLYVAARGKDVKKYPDYNDGKIYEFVIDNSSVVTPTVPAPTQPAPTPTATQPAPTATPTQPAPTPTEPGPAPLVFRVYLPIGGK